MWMGQKIRNAIGDKGDMSDKLRNPIGEGRNGNMWLRRGRPVMWPNDDGSYSVGRLLGVHTRWTAATARTPIQTYRRNEHDLTDHLNEWRVTRHGNGQHTVRAKSSD